DEVDDVLLTGARSGNAKLVGVALDQGGPKPATLSLAFAIASSGEHKNTEIADQLKKAGAVPPPQVEASTLQSYVGNYKAERGPDITLSLKDSSLVAAATGQPPFALIATDKVTFVPHDFDGITLIMNLDAGKVVGLTLKQGPGATAYKRVEAAKQP